MDIEQILLAEKIFKFIEDNIIKADDNNKDIDLNEFVAEFHEKIIPKHLKDENKLYNIIKFIHIYGFSSVSDIIKQLENWREYNRTHNIEYYNKYCKLCYPDNNDLFELLSITAYDLTCYVYMLVLILTIFINCVHNSLHSKDYEQTKQFIIDNELIHKDETMLIYIMNKICEHDVKTFQFDLFKLVDTDYKQLVNKFDLCYLDEFTAYLIVSINNPITCLFFNYIVKRFNKDLQVCSFNLQEYIKIIKQNKQLEKILNMITNI